MERSTLEYLLMAKKAANKSPHPKFKMGCVIVTRDGLVIGHNRIKTHPKSTAPYHMMHAEIDAILNASRQRIDLEGSTLYVYRAHKNGNFAMAKPCDGCMIAIQKMKIGRIIYTVNGGVESQSM